MDVSDSRVSSFLDYLPAVFRTHGEDGVSFLGRLLLAFEAVLGGLGDAEEPGLAEKIDRLRSYLDPAEAPAEFLPWLASWVALSLRDDWSEQQQRRFLARIVPLYRKRGTREGLAEMLATYTGLDSDSVEIHELLEPMQIGVHSTVGEDTLLGGGPPHYFTVRMYLSEPNPRQLRRQRQIARAIIDQEKPAHTFYDLYVEVPTMQIGVHSTVGVDTLLGTESE